MPPGGDDPAPHGPVADWTMARLVEAAAVTGPGGRHLTVDSAARAALADLCRSGDERRRAETARLCEGVLVHDAAGRPVAANRRADEMLGGDLAASPAGDAAWRCIAADGRVWPAEERPAALALATGEAQLGARVGIRLPDGRLLWAAVDAVPLRGDDGAVSGVVTCLRDVSEEHELQAALARSEEGFRLLAMQSGDVVARMDMDNRYVYVSPAAERVYGWRPEEMVGRSAFEFIHPEDAMQRHRARLELVEGREAATTEFRMRRPDGGWVWVRGTIGMLRGPDGSPEGLQSTTRDVSRRRAQDEALRRATEQFSSSFSHAPIGMALVGIDGRFLRVNGSLCDLVGYAQDELLELTFQDITHADDLDADMAMLEEVIAGTRASYTMEKRYVRADGRVIWALLAVSLVTDADGVPLHFVSQIQDVSERRELESRLREQAEHDHLTGLFNRRRFDEELRRQIGRTARSGEPAMLAMIDLDHFKRVNDRDGHMAGDTLLREVGEALAGRLRRSDTLGRLGGDEFAAILVGCDEEAGEAIAHMLVSAVAEVVGDDRPVTASVGLARIEAGDDPAAALARADEAMYAAKAAGRGAVRVVAEPE